MVEGSQDARLVEAPGGADKVIRRGVAADSLDDHLGGQKLQEIDECGDVVVAAHEGHLAASHLIGERRTLDGVEVVNLHRVEIQSSYLAGGRQHVVMRFARQAEDYMPADFKAPAAAALDGVDRRIMMVTAVHPVERPVVDGLDAVFEGEVSVTRQFLN